MRLFFLLLVLVNLAFFAYAQIARERADDGRQLPALQIQPDRIKLIGRGDTASSPQPKPPAAPGGAASPAPAVCLEWGTFAGAEAARADAAFARLGLPQSQVQRTTTDMDGYWVYIPPVKTKAELDKRVAGLKALKIAEFVVMQDAGPWRNAISLDIFRSEEAAKKRLEALREQGVKDAVAGRREKFLKQVAYLVREPGQDVVAQLAELRREFPGSQIRALACPAESAKQ